MRKALSCHITKHTGAGELGTHSTAAFWPQIKIMYFQLSRWKAAGQSWMCSPEMVHCVHSTHCLRTVTAYGSHDVQQSDIPCPLQGHGWADSKWGWLHCTQGSAHSNCNQGMKQRKGKQRRRKTSLLDAQEATSKNGKNHPALLLKDWVINISVFQGNSKYENCSGFPCPGQGGWN